MKTRLVYSPHYDFGVKWLDKLHPFDAKKFSRAWALLEAEFGDELSRLTKVVDQPVSDETLLQVHTRDYLLSLQKSKTISAVIEIPLLALTPNYILQKGLINPAKYATAGTLIATKLAFEQNAIVFNLGGGFHHAFADHGEGFCFFADAALALEILKREEKINQNDKVIMIDLDVHRGNGFSKFYESDKNVGIFDLYNMQIYPGLLDDPNDEQPFIIPMRAGLNSEDYLDLLKTEFPLFLDAHQNPKIAFYNAGTDILASDKLGHLNVSYEAVKERDRYIVDALRARNIPTVIMTSGGYSKESYKLVAELASYLIKTGELF